MSFSNTNNASRSEISSQEHAPSPNQNDEANILTENSSSGLPTLGVERFTIAQIQNDHLTQGPSQACDMSPSGSSTCLDSTFTPNIDRYRVVPAKNFIRNILADELRGKTMRGTVGPSDLRDVTLHLTDFLSYAHRNNYDIVIPASRDNRLLNGACMDPSCGYMVLEQRRYPRNASSTLAYHPTDLEYIGLNSTPVRNSVLTTNVYPSSSLEEIQPPEVDFNAPPPYEMPLKLPTYEEVQREKAMEGESLSPNPGTQNVDPSSLRSLRFLAVDPEMGTNPDPESKLLGTDYMFAVAFFLALIFNWVGFLMLMCFCHTVAARYGALSGFGLSLAKWTIIVKNSTDVPIHNAWLWWLITAFGLLICIRSLFQYINIKRGWRLMSSATQERLLFFY